MPFRVLNLIVGRQFASNVGVTKDIVRKTMGATALIELNRPKQLNALNKSIIQQLIEELDDVEQNNSIKVVILTGGGKAFAAGADIAEMAKLTYEDCLQTNFLQNWVKIANFPKPMIAAVNGYAVII